MAKADARSSPDWKETFLSKPSISMRKGIAYDYDAPYEDTSTLVLTALSGKFVDLRLPQQMSYTRSGQPVPLSSHASFWAFSGISETTFYNTSSESKPGFPFTAHTVFHHDIDSKGPGIADEGDLFLLPNGDIMEIGVNDDTKQLYKEYWTEPEHLPGRSSVVKTPVLVAETIGAGNGRGMIIRVGDYIQGIFERKGVAEKVNKVVVHRLTRRTFPDLHDQDTKELKELVAEMGLDEAGAHDIMWLPDLRANSKDSNILPCEMFTTIQDSLYVGAEFVSAGNRWRITELENDSSA